MLVCYEQTKRAKISWVKFLLKRNIRNCVKTNVLLGQPRELVPSMHLSLEECEND